MSMKKALTNFRRKEVGFCCSRKDHPHPGPNPIFYFAFEQQECSHDVGTIDVDHQWYFSLRMYSDLNTTCRGMLLPLPLF